MWEAATPPQDAQTGGSANLFLRRRIDLGLNGAAVRL
jgi:hypothetical protein